MKNRIFFLGLLLAAALSACSRVDVVNPSPPDEFPRVTGTLSDRGVQLGQSFTLNVGDTIQVEGDQFSVTMVDVLEDSRCPTGVECFWEGNAKVQVSVGEQKFTLTLGKLLEGDQNPVNLGDGFILRLLQLDPYPGEGEESQAYQAIFMVEHETSQPYNYPEIV